MIQQITTYPRANDRRPSRHQRQAFAPALSRSHLACSRLAWKPGRGSFIQPGEPAYRDRQSWPASILWNTAVALRSVHTARWTLVPAHHQRLTTSCCSSGASAPPPIRNHRIRYARGVSDRPGYPQTGLKHLQHRRRHFTPLSLIVNRWTVRIKCFEFTDLDAHRSPSSSGTPKTSRI